MIFNEQELDYKSCGVLRDFHSHTRLLDKFAVPLKFFQCLLLWFQGPFHCARKVTWKTLTELFQAGITN